MNESPDNRSMVWVLFPIYVASLNAWFFLLIRFRSVHYLAVEKASVYFSMARADYYAVISILFISLLLLPYSKWFVLALALRAVSVCGNVMFFIVLIGLS